MGATPAITALEKVGVEHAVHSYAHEKTSTDYGAEAVAIMGERIGAAPGQIFKTLVVDLGEGGPVQAQPRLDVGLLPLGNAQLALVARVLPEGRSAHRLALPYFTP